MPKPDTIERLMREFADSEVDVSDGSVSSSILHRNILELTPEVIRVVAFITKCRVTGASLSLIAGNIPMVRVRFKSANSSKTVNPSTWMPDIIASFGIPRAWPKFDPIRSGFPERLSERLKEVITKERIVFLEADVQNARANALVDEHQVRRIRCMVEKRRELERQRQIKTIAQTFKNLPVDLLSEDDIVKLWRETTVSNILES